MTVAVPPETPDTIPVAVVIVATATGLQLQVPPAGVQASSCVAPAQSVSEPVMAVGAGFTVIVFDVKQTPPIVYVIIATPGVRPVATPAGNVIVATPGLLVVHNPPATAFV